MKMRDLSDGLVPLMGVEGLELVRVDRHVVLFGVAGFTSKQIFRMESGGLLPKVKVAGRRAGPT